MTMFIVIDGQAARPGITTGGNEITQNEMYRVIAVTGATYSESDFRAWVNNRWNTPISAPLADHVKACNKGGWRVLQLLEI